MRNYKEFKERQQQEINELPIYWAFGKQQLEELLTKLNLKEEELKDKCFGIFGGIALLEDKEKIIETFKRHDKELEEAMQEKEFLIDAFEYELGNHEYIITYDYNDTLRALGLTELNNFQVECLKIATDNYLKYMEEMGWY